MNQFCLAWSLYYQIPRGFQLIPQTWPQLIQNSVLVLQKVGKYLWNFLWCWDSDLY